MSGGSDPSDLTKMSEEVGHMKARLAEEEDSEFELWPPSNRPRQSWQAPGQELAGAQAAVEAAAPRLQGRLEAIQGDVAEQETARGALGRGPRASPGRLPEGQRLSNPVVAMVGGQCEGCRVRLTTNELQVLRRGERFTCQNCSRILVLN